MSKWLAISNKVKKGFTLIELLVVISIIGILAALSFVSFTTSQRQARDSARKSDIKQYQTSLESFANNHGGLFPQRPDAAGVTASSTLCNDLTLTTCPEDVKSTNDATFTYKYQSDGSVSDGTAIATKYILWTKLESQTNYWVICSSGKVGIVAQAGFGVSGGSCPL